MTVSYQAVLRLMDGQLEVLEASARTMPWGTPGGAAVAEPGAAEHAGPAENTDGTVTLEWSARRVTTSTLPSVIQATN